MMEIKTAEQYVVSELLEKIEIIKDLKEDLTILENSYDELMSKYKTICNQLRSHLSVRKSDNGQIILDFKESLWSEYDKAEFDVWIKLFPDMLIEIEEEDNE